MTTLQTRCRIPDHRSSRLTPQFGMESACVESPWTSLESEGAVSRLLDYEMSESGIRESATSSLESRNRQPLSLESAIWNLQSGNLELNQESLVMASHEEFKALESLRASDVMTAAPLTC